MKFSIITPEHQINNVFINELYDSIKQQKMTVIHITVTNHKI